LSQHSEGVIATTGCLGGHVLQALMNESFDAALEKAGRLQDIFGRDNLFVEIQDHGIPEQHRTNPQLIEIAKRLRAPLLATNDGHYVTAPTPRPTTPCCACRPARWSPTRSGSGSTGPTTT
jgi:DNA polymerase-3 subunit alpha